MSSLPPIVSVDAKKTKKEKALKNLNPLLPCVPHRWVLAAPSKSGKTTFIVNMFKKGYFKGVWKPDNIIVFSRTAHLDDKIKQIPSNNFFNEYSQEVMDDIFQQQEEILNYKGKKKMPQVLVILDDMLGTDALATNSILNKYIHICRHYNVSIWISTQKYTGVPRTVRINSDVLTMWRPYNMSELDSILDEHSSKANRKDMHKALMDIFKEPYQFFHCDYSCYDLNKRYRRGFEQFLDLFK